MIASTFCGAGLPHNYKYALCHYLLNWDVSYILIPESSKDSASWKLSNSLNLKPKTVGGVLIYSIRKRYIESLLHRYLKTSLNKDKLKFDNLKEVSLVYYKKFHSFNGLCSSALRKLGLLGKSWIPFSLNSSARNWFENHYWVGSVHHSYAVGFKNEFC